MKIKIGLMLVAFGFLANSPLLAQFDMSGQWGPRYHEDWMERLPGPDVVDYTGIPINEAARVKADAWEASVQTLIERQCIPHPNPYSLRGPSNIKIWAEYDNVYSRPLAWKVYGTFGHATHTIWMDGRAHPSQYAPHTFEGFTTGVWEGDTLTTYTTHIKMGYIRRNGVPTSDRATVTEHWTRHGNTLTAMVLVDDPIYLTEPYVRSTSWQLDPQQEVPATPCEPAIEVTRKPGVVPHYLPGTNPFMNEVPKMYNIPLEAVRGGADTMYPEYRKKLKDQYVAPVKCKRYCCGWLGGAGERSIAGKLDCDGTIKKD